MHVIRSLLEQLDDPFTRFLEPSRYAALKRGTAGSLTGVGLEVGFDSGAGTDSDLLVFLDFAMLITYTTDLLGGFIWEVSCLQANLLCL